MNALTKYIRKQDKLIALPKAAGHAGNWTPGEKYTRSHAYAYRPDGCDIASCVTDDAGRRHRWLVQPNPRLQNDHALSEMASMFTAPVRREVAARVERHERFLENLAEAKGFSYMPGQKEAFAWMAARNAGLLAAEVGTGKTLGAISIIALRSAWSPNKNFRALVVAPRGVVDGPGSQWRAEIGRFLPPRAVRQVFNGADFKRCNGASGIYLTSPRALLTNKDCVAATCPAGYWDMIIVDESHVFRNISAVITRRLLALEAPAKYCLTATPIYDTARDLFPVLGWLSGWDADVFPYAPEGQQAFEDDVLCSSGNGKRGFRAAKPGFLMSLLEPFYLRVTKKDCNPEIPAMTRRVTTQPLGGNDTKLYQDADAAKWHDDPWVAGGIRCSIKRTICAAAEKKNNTIIRRIASQPGQVLFLSARVKQSDAVQAGLERLGIKTSRIDSSVPSGSHAEQAAIFKRGDASVMIMGVKCAQGYSFDQCRRAVIGSIEWSPGAWEQALGRIHRVTSKHPVTAEVILAADTVEERMFRRVAAKQQAAEEVTP